MKRKPVIGVLDLGASGGRVFAFVWQGGRLHPVEVHRFEHTCQSYPQSNPSIKTIGLCRCWDLPRIFEGLKKGLKAILAQDDLQLVSFGIDSWGSDGTWMSEQGDMLGMIITGRDDRWARAREEIVAKIGARRLFELTGVQSYNFNVLNQIYWYVNHQPKVVDAAATYMPLISLLYHFLTGDRMAEYTWMSVTQLCTLGRNQYNKEIFTKLDLPLEKMPAVFRPGISLGSCHTSLARELSLEPFEVILPATHDTACAYAAAQLEPGSNTMIISAGTWFLAGTVLDQPILSDQVFEAGFANAGGFKGICLLKNIIGTWPAQELRRIWIQQTRKDLTWAQFDEMAASATSFTYRLEMNDPRFFSPASMEEAIVSFCWDTGQQQPSSRAQMARSIYEGLAAEVARTAKNLGELLHKAVDNILIVGGGSRSDVLNQWIADFSGLPVRTGPADATAFGNALIQAIRLGWIGSLSDGVKMMEKEFQQRLFMPKDGHLDRWRPPDHQKGKKL